LILKRNLKAPQQLDVARQPVARASISLRSPAQFNKTITLTGDAVNFAGAPGAAALLATLPVAFRQPAAYRATTSAALDRGATWIVDRCE
jgi:hypothetical protein